MKWQRMAVFGRYSGDFGGFGGWYKRVKFVRFLADFGGVVAAEEDGLGEIWGS